MALETGYTYTLPGVDGASGSYNEMHLEEYTGIVEGTIARKSALQGLVPVRTVKGTSVIQSYAVGESTLQGISSAGTPASAVAPGGTVDGTKNKFSKNTMTIDTLVLARSVFPVLDVWQTQYDARREVGMEHGKKIAKFLDQAFFIQAMKAGVATASKFAGVDGAGHSGASQVTLSGASDYLDPAKLFAAIADLFVSMEGKDVDPRGDDVVIAVKPREFYTLLQNEQLINTEYKTSEGTSIQAFVLKAYGVPVISSNNYPGGSTITDHLLSNADNSAAYDITATKHVAVAFSPRALMAGQTIPLTTAVFWDEKTKMWFVDAHLAFGVAPHRVEFSGVILNP